MTYRILGALPWGGEEERPVLPSVDITKDQYPLILGECIKLIRTAEVAAELPKYAKVDAMQNSPIPPSELHEGILAMGKPGGGYDHDLDSGLDVMVYACRVVDRLLAAMGYRPGGKRRGGYHGRWDEMRECTPLVAAEVYKAASAAGILI